MHSLFLWRLCLFVVFFFQFAGSKIDFCLGGLLEQLVPVSDLVTPDLLPRLSARVPDLGLSGVTEEVSFSPFLLRLIFFSSLVSFPEEDKVVWSKYTSYWLFEDSVSCPCKRVFFFNNVVMCIMRKIKFLELDV